MTLHPSKVPYSLETQIARYLDGDLGVYRPAPPWLHLPPDSRKNHLQEVNFPPALAPGSAYGLLAQMILLLLGKRMAGPRRVRSPLALLLRANS